MKSKGSTALYGRIREILESARAGAARSVNTTQVMRDRASKLAEEFGDGYELTNLKMIRQVYLTYRELVEFAKGHALRDKSDAARRKTTAALLPEIRYAVRSQLDEALSMPFPVIPHAVSAKSWNAQ